jgi:hypothetical protein
MANDIRPKISVEVKKKLISLKVDGASRFSRTLFGINAQLIIDGELTVRSLAVTELRISSRATYL